MEILFFPPDKQCGFRLELLCNEPGKNELFEEMSAPFFTLFETGRYARVLGAQVVSREDRRVFRLAVKLQRDQYSLGLGSRPDPQETNPNVDRMWQRELDHLRSYCAPDSPVVSLFEWGLEQPLKPILFCKKKRLFLRPRCPVCSMALSTCRQDLPLSRRALPVYSQSLTRYLCCPDCAREDPEGVPLYSHRPANTDRDRGVLGPSDLIRDTLGTHVLGSPQKARNAEQRKQVAEDVCCLDCEERRFCFGTEQEPLNPPEACGRITPLAFYDFYMLPQEYLPIRYDEHNKLLGGADPAILRLPLWPGECRGPAGSSAAASSHPVRRRAFLFPPGNQRALETFYLKMTAFHQLCEDLRSFYRTCQTPHLQLGPENVMVALSDNGSHLPLAWNFRVKLIDLESGQRFEPEPKLVDLLPDIRRPIREADRLYADPIFQRKFGQQNWMKMTLEEVSETPLGDAEILCKIRGLLSSDAVDLQTISGKDLIHLTLHQEQLGVMGAEFWGRKQTQEDKNCRVECFSRRLNPREKGRIQLLRNRDVEALVSLFPVYHLPCDLYSLGLMLLDSLLANPSNERLEIRETHGALCGLMETYLFNHPLADHTELLHYFREICMTDRPSRVLNRNNLFFSPQENDALASSVPGALWFDALVIAFRLASHLPVFSFCSDHGDFSAEQPEEKLNLLICSLDELRAKIQAELFETHQANEIISRALKKVASESRHPPSGDTPVPAAPPEKKKAPSHATQKTHVPAPNATEDPKKK